MSFNETIERSKLNQAMYKKLKKYIMSQRKQQVERKEHDDHHKRVMLEKAKRRRQAQIDHENMESLQRELSEATKKRDELRDQKHNLFTRFKQLANDESILKDKQKSEVQQMAPAALPRSYHMQNIPDTMSTSMSNAAIPTSMLGYTSNKMDPVNENNPVSSNHSPMTMSVNDLATVIRYSGLSPAIIDALYKNNNTQRILNQTVVSSMLNNATAGINNQGGNNSGSSTNNLLANSGLTENALAAIFANINNPAVASLLPPGLLPVDLHGSGSADNNSCINQSTNQSLTPLLAQLQQLEKYGGGLNAATVAALSQQLESIRQGPNNSQRLIESLKQLNNNTVGCFDSFNGSQLSNSAFNNLVGSALLPPAPTSYRGSITTGQSAQNIQLQVYQQQQQHMLMAAAAKIVNSVNHNSSASQHQTSHLGNVLPQHHNLNLPPISTNVLQIGSNPIRQSGQNDSSSLYSSALDQHSSYYNRNIITSSGQNNQQTAAASALAAAVNYSNQAQLVHHLNAHAGLASTPQNYRQNMPQPPHSVHNNYF